MGVDQGPQLEGGRRRPAGARHVPFAALGQQPLDGRAIQPLQPFTEDLEPDRNVLDLPDVRRPPVAQQGFCAVHGQALLHARPGEVTEERQDVLAALRQTGEHDGDTGEAGEEVPAEATLPSQCFEGLVRRRHHPEIDGELAFGPDGTNSTLLQHAQ